MARGHIRERGDAHQVVIYLGKDSDGKKKYKYETVRGGIRKAEKALTKLLRELNTNTLIDPGKITLAQYLERFVQDYCQIKLSPKTLKDYKGMIERDISPLLGHIPLVKLQPLDLQNYYTRLMTGNRKGQKSQALCSTSVLYHHRVIHRALELAVKWQLIYRNVADAVEPPRKAEHEFSVVDAATLEKLLFHIKEHYPVAYLPIIVAAYTGMRRSEVCGLRWKDVGNKQISVNKQLQRVDGELVIRETKNRNGRSIPMPDFLSILLDKHQKEQKKNIKWNKITNKLDLVFIWPDNGRPLDPDYLTKVFIQKTCKNKKFKELGLNKVRLHDLRHSFATLLLGKKVHPKVVQELLGHSSITLTLDTYSHVLPSMKEEVADILNEEQKKGTAF